MESEFQIKIFKHEIQALYHKLHIYNKRNKVNLLLP